MSRIAMLNGLGKAPRRRRRRHHRYHYRPMHGTMAGLGADEGGGGMGIVLLLGVAAAAIFLMRKKDDAADDSGTYVAPTAQNLQTYSAPRGRDQY